MITLDEAVGRVLDRVKTLPTETVPLAEAPGRVLAEALVAGWALPPHDNSGVDGYALRHADLPGPLPLGTPIYAGSVPAALESATAVRITTGARAPQGADTIVPQEIVEVDWEMDGGSITVHGEIERGANIRPAGEDTVAGQQLAAAGTPIGPDLLSVLAAFGHAEPRVYRRPRVTIISGGDELVPVERASSETITDSNAPGIRARAEQMGARVEQLDITPDDENLVRERIRGGLDRSDLIITIGGASVGDRDYVRPALRAEGVTLEFERVAMRPGKPTGFGHRGDKLAFALPGNPRAAAVAFEMFVRPALEGMSGQVPAASLFATLGADVDKKPGFAFILPARVHADVEGRLHAYPTARKSSGLLTSPLGCNGIVILPAGPSKLTAGTVVPVRLTQP